jgi:signal transduction histidine kinase
MRSTKAAPGERIELHNAEDIHRNDLNPAWRTQPALSHRTPRAVENLTRTEAARESERLRSALMDAGWIKKVLQHLLENAAKYSPAGSPIYISAEVRNDRLITSVADRGAGIDDLERSMVFDKFYRGQSQCYRVQGTGMGLAIVKAIVEAHGGRIEVTSQVGQGSVFQFGLPLVTADASRVHSWI